MPYCLIALLTISLVACKNGSDSSGGGSGTTTPATNATPLQGTWIHQEQEVAGVSGSETFVFNGSNCSLATVVIDASSSPSVTTTMTLTGTFRLDNGNLYLTIQNATYVSNTTTPINCTTFEEVQALIEAAGGSLGFSKGTEFLYGAYAVNGNTLTLTDTNTSSTISFTKQ